MVQETAVAVFQKLFADGCWVESGDEFQVLEEGRRSLVGSTLYFPSSLGGRGGR